MSKAGRRSTEVAMLTGNGGYKVEENMVADIRQKMEKHEEEQRMLLDERLRETEAKLEAAMMRRVEVRKAQVDKDMEALDTASRQAMEILIKANRRRPPFEP